MKATTDQCQRLHFKFVVTVTFEWLIGKRFISSSNLQYPIIATNIVDTIDPLAS